MSLLIHREHPDWLVVEKPAHLLVHPTRPDGTHTLWHDVLAHFPNETLALVNRLDRETSGLIIVGRSKESTSTLGKMMMKREVSKHYFALVLGTPPKEGVIDEPIDRIGKYRESLIYLKRGVIEGGYPSTTKYRVIETRHHSSGVPISLLSIELMTGRVHQIRVHMQHIGFPVIGDKIYGPDEQCYLDFIENGWTLQLAEQLWLPRHALHACTIRFEWKGEAHEVHSPFSHDLEDFWNTLSVE